MMAWCTCLLLATLLTTGHSWVLTTTHSNVILTLSDDVCLKCQYENNGAVPLSPLSRLRLLKLNGSKWQTYAEILPRNRTQPILNYTRQPDVSTTGLLRQPSQSFLSVTWATASEDTVGSYKCEIDGFTSSAGANHEKYTRVVNITNHAANVNDLLNMIIHMRRKMDNMSRELRAMDTQHASKRQVLKRGIMNEVDSAIKGNLFEARFWPSAFYTLLADAHGCPNNPFSSFEHTSFTVQTKTSQKTQHVFPPGFNATRYTSIDNLNLLRFDFCTYKRTVPTWAWPAGSYCMFRYGRTSPAGFQYGYTRFYLESLVNMVVSPAVSYGPFAAQYSSKYIDFYFFCRSDGNTSTPILLPSAKPFYLFRYGGTCQTVFNMNVTNVKIEIDTDSTKAGSFGNAYHADGSTDGRIELCYYTKKNPTAGGTVP